MGVGERAGVYVRDFLRNPAVSTFETLVANESAILAKSTRAADEEAQTSAEGDETRQKREHVVAIGAAAEPWVSSTTKDRLGLALSGGGIRSATFNLGLLQALGALGVLKHVDYLATVSGGGYIGGFWTTWIVRHSPGRGTGNAHFPVGSGRRGGERAEVRHLREFSRFLLPRLGMHRTDFWELVMTVLGGLLPSLTAALAVVAMGWLLWLSLMLGLATSGSTGYQTMGALMLVFFTATEAYWRGKSGVAAPPTKTRAHPNNKKENNR
jgi:hypothetical protein